VILADDVAAALPEMRAQAEALMFDACKIGTETMTGARDETTGKRVTQFDVVYEGRCRIKAGTTGATEVAAAGQELTEQASLLKLPVATSGGVRTDMVVIITACPTDPALVGTRARIKGEHLAAGATSRRLPIEVVT